MLHLAAGFNALRVLRLLLDSRADTNAKDELGRTALYYAARYGHLEVASLLLDAHAQINATDNAGWTAIMIAASGGKASVCKLLAARGADLLATSATGCTAIHLAAEEGHADVVKVLLPHLCRLDNVDLRNVQSQLPELKDGPFGHTALHYACMNGHHLVAERLLAAGASRTATDSDGFTPLHHAARYGHLACLTLVVGHPGAYLLSPAELDAHNTHGGTPLYEAAYEGHRACCAALIAAGADTAKADLDGHTPLIVAADEGQPSVCKLLAVRGVDLLATTQHGYTAIHLAASNGYADVVKVLLPHLRRLDNVDLCTVQSQDEDDKDEVYGQTALQAACINGHHLVAKRLLAAGASRSATDSDGSTPLHCAANFGHLACLTLVMGHPGAYLLSNAALNVEDIDGEAPLYQAAYFGHHACCATLIAAGTDTAKAAKDGSTPLSIAQSRHADKPQLIALPEAHSGANAGTPLVLRCEGCGKPSTEAPRGRLRACAACQGASFCCPECAQRGWIGGHQAECSRIIAAKAAI